MKKIYVYVLTASLIGGGYFLYALYQKKQDADFAQEVLVSDFEDMIPSRCENGEWTEFPDYGKSGNFSEYKGNANIKSTSVDTFTNQDGSLFFTTNQNYSLTFFVDREVRIEGTEIGTKSKKNIYVKRIKCVGKEANKDIQLERRNLMVYISNNIDSLAMEKSYGSVWQVQTFYFVNDVDIYVEYESLGSLGGDAPYDARLWLIRASRMGGSVPIIETLGYIQEDENDPDKNVVKVGQDLYRDAGNMMVYEFDDDKKVWTLQ